MITHLLVPEPNPPGRTLSNCLWISGTMAEGYPSRMSETAGLLRDQFIKTPRMSRCYNMYTEQKYYVRSKVSFWSRELVKLNSSFSRVARHSLPSAPASRPVFQETLRKWERSAREQTLMCNQIAGLSRSITKVQDTIKNF